MKILVPVKRVPDPYAKVTVLPDGSGLDTAALKFEINPFDEIAVEEAVRISEQREAEVVVVSIGKQECEEQLRKALAIGAHRGVLVETDAALDSLGVAKILAKVYEREQPDFVLMGKQAIDDDANQAGQMLAAMLGIPQMTFAAKVELLDGIARVTRETDTGQETLEAPLPCVITTDLRLNEPRYVALPGIIKARSKPIETISLPDLGVQAECRVRVVKLRPPAPRQAGRRVQSVDELIAALREKGVLAK
jgi:electron transfer flavoprotein beta subunit